jgi:ATP-dependent exoDNAse (exonuclease V) alpha subunit
MSKLSELIAAAKAKAAASAASTVPVPKLIATEASIQVQNPESNISQNTGAIIYNAEQQAFIDAAISGKSAVLIGAAGTGKTTCMKGTIASLLQSTYYPTLQDTHKHLPQATPGIIACSFTRRAVANLRKAMPDDLKPNCITIHKLLEYAPVYYEVFDNESGTYKNTMRFEPTRTKVRTLDSAIKTIIIDESSMVSLELFQQLWNALPNPHTTQFIYLGDIQQLPPVFGSAILGYKMVEHTASTIELIQVYRQALESPIIRLAHRILSGKPIPAEEYPDWHYPNQLKLHPWKKSISADSALLTMAAFFKKAYDTQEYNPEEDMILIPFNKSCGTTELNKHIANHLARKEGKVTYEIVAGFNKHYLSIGDKVLYDKEDAVVIDIAHNGMYSGKWPQEASKHLDYWGHRIDRESKEEGNEGSIEDAAARTEAEVDQMLAAMAAGISDSKEDKVNNASHLVTVRMLDSDEEIVLDAAAEINSLLMGYALTVHRSQGSEWRKVFLMLHSSHNTMIQRELLYTACTRAREELYVICEPDHFTKGILNQRIKGNTLEEKAVYFRGKSVTNQSEI